MKQNQSRSQNRRPQAKAPTTKIIFPWLSPHKKRQLIILSIFSFVVSLVLELYTFGFPDGFFGRWFSAMLVMFLFFSVTVLGIIPLISYVVNRWLRF